MADLHLFEKTKKIEIEVIEKKLIDIHKSVVSKLACSDILNKEEIIFWWKKCDVHVTDIKEYVTQFFGYYKNFSICNEINILIGEYFIYLIVYLKNLKKKKAPFKVINLYIFNNNKWKHELIYNFLKGIFLNDDGDNDYCMNYKTLVIEYLINNYDIFNSSIGFFYTNILKYINTKLQINFSTKNQNNLNVYANFLITFNSNATLELTYDMLKVFSLISNNLKHILLQFPFDKDICTHVCLIYQQVTNIIINYEKHILNILRENEYSNHVIKECNFEKDYSPADCKSKIDQKTSDNHFVCDINKKKINDDNKKTILDISNCGEKYNEKNEVIQNEYEESRTNECLKNIGNEINETKSLVNIELLNKYLFFITKIKKLLRECDNVIKKKKSENPFLILCKYRSILIIKYKYVKNITIDDSFYYFMLFFKIKNLLNECNKNPFIIFLCIETINYWLQKNDKLQYVFELGADCYLKNNSFENNDLSYKSQEFYQDKYAENCLLNKKNNGISQVVTNEKLKTHPEQNCDFSKSDLYEKCQNEESDFFKEDCDNDKNKYDLCKKQDNLQNVNDTIVNFVQIKDKNIYDIKEGGIDIPNMNHLNDNIISKKIKELFSIETNAEISYLKNMFKNFNSDECKIKFLKELYKIIINNILSILKKYSWYNVKIIWRSCINVYESLLTSKITKFIKNDIYNSLAYIIFNQDKKKKYLCLSLLLKHFKNSMCEQNVLEHLFYCFFLNDDYFMFNLYELLKQCIKHIFNNSEDKYLLYYIFIKNVLITNNFYMKTFYIKKFIELFYKNDNNYLYFVLNKEYFHLKPYFDKYNDSTNVDGPNNKNDNDNNVETFMHLNKISDLRNIRMNEQYFQFVKLCLLENTKLEKILYDNLIYNNEDNIFLNYKVINFKRAHYDKDELESGVKEGENENGKYLLYNFSSIENIMYLELYLLCTLRKYELIELVNYKNDYYYELNGNFLLNAKTLNRFFYFSDDEVILPILSFICENKYLNLGDLYLFLTFLNTSINSISRTSRDSYRKYIILFFDKFFIYYQRMIELGRKMRKKEHEDIKSCKENEKIAKSKQRCNGENIKQMGKIYSNLNSLEKPLKFLFGNINVIDKSYETHCNDNNILKNVYSSCIFHSSNNDKYFNEKDDIFLYNYYLMNIIFILFKNTNKDMGIEASAYCFDILNIIINYCAHFENINFFFFLFNINTTWKEFYLLSKELFFKTVSIILIRQQKFNWLNNFIPSLIKSHKQVDHAFSTVLLKLCFISLNINDRINEKKTFLLCDNNFEKRNYSISNQSDQYNNPNIIILKNDSSKLHVNKNVYPSNFFNCYIKFGDIKNIKENNIHLRSYINYLFNDNEGYNMARNIPLYILENFINKIKKENIVKLTKCKHIENCEIYKLAYYLNEFILYLKENINFVKNIVDEDFYKIFCKISVCNIKSYLNFDKLKTKYSLNNDISASSYNYLILLKIYICNILHNFMNYLNFLFLNNSKDFLFDCRGHILFEKENEQEATSIIIWLSIKYICILITSIIDFSFIFSIHYNRKNDNIVLSQNGLNETGSNSKENKIIEEKGNKSNDEETKQNLDNRKDTPIFFFSSTEIHYIIQNLLSLLLYSKHIACQQYLSDCLLNICKIITTQTYEDMQTIPLFYIYFILLIFKKENNIIEKNKEKINIYNDNEMNNNLEKDTEKCNYDHINSNNSDGNNDGNNGGNNDDNNDDIAYSHEIKDKGYNNPFLNKIISKLNIILSSKDFNDIDINELLSSDFFKGIFSMENDDKCELRDKKRKGKKIDDANYDNYFERDNQFKINEKLKILLIDNNKVNINFLRKSNNVCLALISLAKSYRIKDQCIIYNFIIRVITNYLYNGNNEFKKVISLNVIKYIYTIIDNKTLYGYINDTYKISLMYYKSKFFCLKSSSMSLYNILTKRLLAKLNYSYHVSSNMYYFCTGSKSRLFKNINLTFFDLLNSVNLLKIFLSIFMKKCKLLNGEFFNTKKCMPFFDYSNVYAEFIPILAFLSNIIIFNNDDYFLLYNNKGDLSCINNMSTIFKKEYYRETDINNEDDQDILTKNNNCNEYENDDNIDSVDNIKSNTNNVGNIHIYFLFIKYFKKLLKYGNYFIQSLICRIIVNIYLHIYLKLKKVKLVFNFLDKVITNVAQNNDSDNKRKNKNHYFLLLIEFCKRKEIQALIDENKNKFKNIFFKLLYIFIKSKNYSEMLLILQNLNILYKKISLSINKNIILLLFNKMQLYNKDMFISVLINQFLMKILKNINNFVAILELYVSNNNEYHIEAFLYNWVLNIKKKEKIEFKIKEHKLNKLSCYNTFKFFSNYIEKQNKNDVDSVFIANDKSSCYDKNNFSQNLDNALYNQNLYGYNNNTSNYDSIDERVYIYLYLLLFEIMRTYKDNIKIIKYCIRIILTIINFISLENLMVFERMQQYYMKNINKNYLDKYIISYSYIICVKYYTENDNTEEMGKQQNGISENDFIKNIIDYVDNEKNKIISCLNQNKDNCIINYVYFYYLLFINFFSFFCNKNSITYMKYFTRVFQNYGIIEYNYNTILKKEEKLKKIENNNQSTSNQNEKSDISKYYHTTDKIHNMYCQNKENITKCNYSTSIINCVHCSNDYINNKDDPNYNIFKNESQKNCMRNEKFEKWYKNPLNKYIREIVYKKSLSQNITCDFIYIKNPLKHLKDYNLFTSFFIVLYSCLIFMLNDENEAIRYQTKIAIIHFMKKNVLNISNNIKDITCTEFFLYYISLYYNKIAAYMLNFCIYQVKNCINDSLYYNPPKLFDQEKYNLYINNILLNHLFMFYYIYNIHIITEKNAISYFVKDTETEIDFNNFIDSLHNRKKDKIVENVNISTLSVELNKSLNAMKSHNPDLYLLKHPRVWENIITNLLSFSNKEFSTIHNNNGYIFITLFLSSLRLNYISKIIKNLDDYLLLLQSNKNIDLFDSNFIICLTNLFNKIIILLINIYIFFKNNINLYYNSYFCDEVEIIKNKLSSICDIFKLIKYETNPFLLKTMEILLSILNNAYLKNERFFPDIYTLLYSLKMTM
ncbi:conserved Plasmodium protein, unknown function [Plasmodium yoelii]|uniref:Uncharacterized protein n=3 Tax=Plasmodium yoelii TaxID=5861 RepID=A0AAF0B343_PLAYO|nr:conserved Plasmodium protein, unknown function [Plasmodium yoelii]WBY60792.1 hypothetical protein Py17XNL_001401061 [Plasmodium yoelii yoelii]CDU20566.1 conserved Plasmodium protein, unknown function [Plasmodium yoelii]VTZ81527.1 conserved Plasmodium protein, unknown function [Plasmodium yoelii]|eukprot:XP_724224.2 conserved Plasmodium protein, unknown function [Plasmodium yoelii]